MSSVWKQARFVFWRLRSFGKQRVRFYIETGIPGNESIDQKDKRMLFREKPVCPGGQPTGQKDELPRVFGACIGSKHQGICHRSEQVGQKKLRPTSAGFETLPTFASL